MPFTADDFLYGLLAPVAIAAIATAVMWRLPPLPRGTLWFAPLAGMLAAHSGYHLLHLGPLRPTSHWHWLPVAGWVSVIVGPCLELEGRFIQRTSLAIVASAVVGWFLVPTWEDLVPGRFWLLGLWTVIVTSMALTLAQGIQHNSGQHNSGKRLAVLFAVALVAATVLNAMAGSLRFAQLTLCAAAAWSGLCIVATIDKRIAHLHGGILTATVLLCASLLVGQVNSFSDIPRICYLLIALAPLVEISSAWSPRMTPRIRAAIFTAVCTSAILLAAVVELR